MKKIGVILWAMLSVSWTTAQQSTSFTVSEERERISHFRIDPDWIGQLCYGDDNHEFAEVSELLASADLMPMTAKPKERKMNVPLEFLNMYAPSSKDGILNFLLDVVREQKQFAHLLFENNAPVVVAGGELPALMGWEFGKGPTREMVIMNLSDLSYDLSFREQFDQPALYDQISTTNALDPTSGRIFAKEGNGLGWNEIGLKPYSITRIHLSPDEAPEFIRQERSFDISAATYNPSSGELQIECPLNKVNFLGVSVLDSQGKAVQSTAGNGLSLQGDRLSMNGLLLEEGVYTVRVETTEAQISRRLKVH